MTAVAEPADTRPDATTDDRPRLPYLPAVDGLRGAAVLAVLCFHGGFGWAVGGYLGVSTFFTLSGFLITALLLTERSATGTVSLGAFWARRFRRLLPAAIAGLLLAVAYGAFAADAAQVADLRGDVVAALLYVANWRFIFDSQSYADLFSGPSPVLHYWSLAIEEQFYVLYPLLMAAVLGTGLRTRFSRRRVLGVLGALTAASLALTLFGGLSDDTVYFNTLTRAAELLVGAVLAVVLFDRGLTRSVRSSPRLRAAVGAAGSAAAVVMVVLWATTEQSSTWLHSGGFAAYALLSALVILAAVVPGNPVRAALGSAPLRAVGLVSYGLYLYHWPIFLWVDDASALDGGARFAAGVAITVPVAWVSYRYLEQPIRRGLRPWGRNPAVLVVPAAAVLAVALVAATADPPEPTIDFAAAENQEFATGPTVTSPPPAEGGPDVAPEPPPARFAFFGDSTAMMTMFGVNSYGVQTGEYVTTEGETILGCGIARGGERRRDPSAAPERPADVCPDWTETWAAKIARDQPNVTVVQIGQWEVPEHRIPGDDTFRIPGDPVYDDWLRAEMLTAVDVLSAEGAVVLWLTNPLIGPAEDGTDPVERHGPPAEPARMERINELIREVAAERPLDVAVVDLAGWLEASGDDRRLRPDGIHLSDVTTHEVAERWLVGALLDAYEELWAARATAEAES